MATRHNRPNRQADDDQRRSWKERYEQLVETIGAQTGSPSKPSDQPAAARRSSISVVMGHANIHPSTTSNLLDRALQNGDVAKVRDYAGRECFLRATENGFRAVLAELNQDEDAWNVTKQQVAEWIREVGDNE